MSVFKRIFGSAPASDAIAKAAPPDAGKPLPETIPDDPRAFRTQNILQEQLAQDFSGDLPAHEHIGAGRMTYASLAYISQQSLVSPFHSLRVGQVGEHGLRRRDRFSPGTEIRMIDPKGRITRAAQKRVDEIWEMMTRGGNYRARLEMLARDSFRYDQANFEVAYTRGGRPWAWQPVDSSMMRLAKPKLGEIASLHYNPRERGVVQIWQNNIVRKFDHREMGWGIRRGRTDIGINGYGYPEQQEAIGVLADLINASTHNSLFFRNGMHASMLLLFKMQMDPEVFKIFSQRITAKLRGVENVHRLAALMLNPGDSNGAKEETVEKLDLAPSNKDMEFQQYFNFLHKLMCSIWGVHPAEVGLGDPADMGRATLNDKGAREEILMARERGLRPGLRAFENWFNTWLIEPFDADFELRMEGMDATTPSALAELRSKEMGSYRSMNQIRDEDDEPRIDHPLADLPMNQTFMTAYMQMWGAEQAQQQAQQQGQEGGDPGEMGQDGQPPDDQDPDGPPDDGDDSWEVDDGGSGAAPAGPVAKGATARTVMRRTEERAIRVLANALKDGRITRRRPYRKGQQQTLIAGATPGTYAIVDLL